MCARDILSTARCTARPCDAASHLDPVGGISMASDAFIQSRNRQPSTDGLPDRHVAPATSTEVEQLRAALVSNRRISLAMGILIRDQDMNEEQAFGYLRRQSNDSNRKLRDVAEDVIYFRGIPRQAHRNSLP